MNDDKELIHLGPKANSISGRFLFRTTTTSWMAKWLNWVLDLQNCKMGGCV